MRERSILRVYRFACAGLLLFLSVVVVFLSQIDHQALEQFYTAVTRFLYIDLGALGVTTTQVSDVGHSVAGFVLSGLAQIVIRRWWVLPLILLFFLGMEAAQLLSVERQASWIDLMRQAGSGL
ncbi:MAG: hypothetical protein KDI68_15580 [Gammaproteobacteria bacterium]|nr:hypothetical protein [Gammaproteobacteria bacterium]